MALQFNLGLGFVFHVGRMVELVVKSWIRARWRVGQRANSLA